MFYNINNNRNNNIIPIRQKLFSVLSSSKVNYNNSIDNQLNKSQSTNDYNKYRISDIFFRKPEENIYLQKISHLPKIKSNDIFNIHNKSDIIYKSKYNISKEEYGEWIPQTFRQSLFNHSNSNYNIISPKARSINKSREELEKISSIQLSKRQKSLSEIIDLERVTAPHKNHIYIKAIEKDKNVFHRKRNVCAVYYGQYHNYKNLCLKPFHKKKILD